jgi:hypothetical protein
MSNELNAAEKIVEEVLIDLMVRESCQNVECLQVYSIILSLTVLPIYIKPVNQDQGYEFHFSWLLILIAFIMWELPEGAMFPEIEPFEPLAAKFCTLWYSSDMNK